MKLQASSQKRTGLLGRIRRSHLVAAAATALVTLSAASPASAWPVMGW